MKVTICYVSYRPDLIWLVYSLQVLFKFLKGNYDVVVRIDENCRDVVSGWALPVRWSFLSHGWPDGYTHAMYQKMTADDFCDWDTDIVWLLDSDHMLVRETRVEDMFEDGKPIIHYMEWNQLDPELARVAQLKWKEPVKRALGLDLDKDYMVMPPFAFWLDTFRNVRQRITKLNGTSFFDFGYSDRPYSFDKFMDHPMRLCDYETLGLYAASQEASRYVLKPAVGKDWPFKVYWSHGGCTPELQGQFETLLAHG